MPFRETACDVTAIDSSPAGRSLTPVGSDDESSHDSRHVPNHAPTVASSVLHHDIAGRQQHLCAIVDLDYDVAGEKDPEIRRVGPVHTGFVAVLHVHLGSGFRCNHAVRRVRRQNLADAPYQVREARFAESLLNGVVRSVEDWAKPSFHRAGHHTSLMHLAAHRKNSALAFDRLVDLTESNARCRVSETDTALAALA